MMARGYKLAVSFAKLIQNPFPNKLTKTVY